MKAASLFLLYFCVNFLSPTSATPLPTGEDCFKVQLTRVACSNNETSSAEKGPHLVESLVAVQDQEVAKLIEENDELKKKFEKTYVNLEQTLDTLKFKMVDWSQQQVKLAEQQDDLIVKEREIVTLQNSNDALTLDKKRQQKKVITLQSEKSKLAVALKKKKEALAASEVKNEYLLGEMAKMRQEIADVRREKTILSFLYGNASLPFNCSDNGGNNIEVELLREQLADEEAKKQRMMNKLSGTIAWYKLNCPVGNVSNETNGIYSELTKQQLDLASSALLDDPVFTEIYSGPYQCSSEFEGQTVADLAADLVRSKINNKNFPSVVCHTGDDEKTWIVIQRRINGSVNFHRNFNDYKAGFGDLDGEFWLGLEAIHQLTKNKDYMLRMDLEDWDGIKWFAEYEFFSVGAGDDYTLTVSGYRGSIRFYKLYGFERLNGMKFSTVDKDQDGWRYNCAAYRHQNKFYHSGGGGWWFRACSHVNLNGKYYNYDLNELLKSSNVVSYPDGVFWHTNKPTGMLTRYSFKHVQMKIRMKT